MRKAALPFGVTALCLLQERWRPHRLQSAFPNDGPPGLEDKPGECFALRGGSPPDQQPAARRTGSTPHCRECTSAAACAD